MKTLFILLILFSACDYIYQDENIIDISGKWSGYLEFQSFEYPCNCEFSQDYNSIVGVFTMTGIDNVSTIGHIEGNHVFFTFTTNWGSKYIFNGYMYDESIRGDYYELYESEICIYGEFVLNKIEI